MEIDQIPDFVLDALRERGHDDDSIKEMRAEEAFSEYCDWYGLSGWAYRLTIALDHLREAEGRDILSVAEAALEYIDAIPKGACEIIDTVTMPGFDRDWADQAIALENEARA